MPALEVAPSRAGKWRSVADYLVKRRVRITLAVFFILIAEDVLTGVKPHGIFDYRDPRSVLGCMLVFAGLALRSWAAGTLHKTWQLTTTGPYALIRNPLYVGSFMIMAGYCTIIDDGENIWVVLGPLAGLYLLQILHEERTLSQLYGERWDAYVREVPRLIPRRLPTGLGHTWSSAQWLRSHEYNALGASLLGLLILELWRVL